MWPYNKVTRQELEDKKDLVERLLRRLGAAPTDLGRSHLVSSYGAGIGETHVSYRAIYQYKGSFYRVDEVLFQEKPFLVIECASKEEYARNNVMEDVDPFPWDLGEDEITATLRKLLEIELC